MKKHNQPTLFGGNRFGALQNKTHREVIAMARFAEGQSSQKLLAQLETIFKKSAAHTAAKDALKAQLGKVASVEYGELTSKNTPK